MSASATTTADAAAIITMLALPLGIALLARDRRKDAAAFLTNEGGNGFAATLAGAVAGNVGIGSFIAIVLFASQSPLVGASVAVAYALGLLLSAALAPIIRARASQTQTRGLVDLIAASHGNTGKLAIWVPVAIVFVLRSAVQIAALALIVSEAVGLSQPVMILGCTAVLGLYLLVGGYRAAVETDMAQSLVLVAGIALAAFGLAQLPVAVADPGELGPHSPVLLVAIWLFLPWSAVLAVDNWQRIVLARTTRVAVSAYIAAAIICGGAFAVMVWAGIGAPPGADMRGIFADLMPPGLAWVASAMFVACIMSSIDTFVMPLTTSLGVKGGMTRLRLTIVALLIATAACALAFGDVLANVIAAFNSLVVFLPAALGALFLRNPSAQAAWLSMNAGLVATIVLTLVARDLAALVGCLVAALAYLACLRLTSPRGNRDALAPPV